MAQPPDSSPSDLIDIAIRRLEAAWRRDGHADLADFVPPAHHPRHVDCLLALIRIDQAYRWNAGQRKAVEQYLAEWPALRKHPDLITTLREAEGELQGQEGKRARDATAAFLDKTLEFKVIGKCIGPYHLLELLGEGGFGVVYLAEQKEPVRRRVALKVVKPGMDTRQVLARFEAERQALAMMDHPNIAKIFDAGVTDSGRSYFVMELVHGEPITTYCDRLRLTLEERLKLFLLVCEAVQHAHQKGIIHRDVKPSNVLVTVVDQRPIPKIIDFGVAKAIAQPLTQQTIFTEQGQLIGTPEYMSPEQAEMTSLDIDTRSDVYSLGVMLYELLTGLLPFDRETLRSAGLNEIRRIIREVEPPKPSTKISTVGEKGVRLAQQRQVDLKSLHRGLRSELDWIVMKTLEKDRTRRYPTALSLYEDIDRYLRHEPVQAGPPGAVYVLRKWLRRNRLPLGIAAAVGLVLLAGVVASTYFAIAAGRHARLAAAAASGEQAARIDADAQREAALHQARQERLARQQVERERNRANALLYSLQISGALRAWDVADLPTATALLDACAGGTFRGWEYGYLRMEMVRGHRAFAKHDAMIHAMALSPDGTQLATASADETVRLWDVASGRELLRLTGHRDLVFCLAFSPLGEHLASGARNGTLKVWDLKARQEFRNFAGHAGPIYGLAFFPDGQRFVTVGEDKSIRIWGVASGEEKRLKSAHSSGVKTVAINHDGSRIATADFSGAIKVWDPETAKELRTLRGHSNAVFRVAFSPDGRRLASSSRDRSVRLWDVEEGVELRVLSGHTDRVDALAFSPDGERVASGSKDRTIRLWDSKSGRELTILKGHMSLVSDLVFLPNGHDLLSGDGEGIVKRWMTPAGPHVDVLSGHRGAVVGLVFSPDGRHLVSASWDKTVRIWDTETGRPIHNFDTHAGLVHAVAFAPDGNWVASASQDGTVRLWDVRAGRESRSWQHPAAVKALAFDPKGRWIASAALDKRIRLWGFDSNKEVLALPLPANVFHLAFAPDGRSILVSGTGRISIWNLDLKAETLSLEGQGEPAFDRSGSQIVVAAGQAAKILDLKSRTVLQTLSGHGGFVTCATFSPDGRRVVTGSDDHSVRVWDATNALLLLELKGHSDQIRNVVFSPDGQRLASSSLDGTIRFWGGRK